MKKSTVWFRAAFKAAGMTAAGAALVLICGMTFMGCSNGTTETVPLVIPYETPRYEFLSAASSDTLFLKTLSNPKVIVVDSKVVPSNETTPVASVSLGSKTVGDTTYPGVSLTANEPLHTISVYAEGEDTAGNKYDVRWNTIQIDAAKRITHTGFSDPTSPSSIILQGGTVFKIGLPAGLSEFTSVISSSTSVGGVTVTPSKSSDGKYVTLTLSGTGTGGGFTESMITGKDTLGNSGTVMVGGSISSSGTWSSYPMAFGLLPDGTSAVWYVGVPSSYPGMSFKSGVSGESLSIGSSGSTVTAAIESSSKVKLTIAGSGADGTLNVGVTYQGKDYVGTITVSSSQINTSGKWNSWAPSLTVDTYSNTLKMNAPSGYRFTTVSGEVLSKTGFAASYTEEGKVLSIVVSGSAQDAGGLKFGLDDKYGNKYLATVAAVSGSAYHAINNVWTWNGYQAVSYAVIMPTLVPAETVYYGIDNFSDLGTITETGTADATQLTVTLQGGKVVVTPASGITTLSSGTIYVAGEGLDGNLRQYIITGISVSASKITTRGLWSSSSYVPRSIAE